MNGAGRDRLRRCRSLPEVNRQADFSRGQHPPIAESLAREKNELR